MSNYKYVLECTSGNHVATLILEKGLPPSWRWRCEQGAGVWGGSGGGTTGSDLINGGTGVVELSTTDYLSDFSRVETGSYGEGFRGDTYGGSFPAGLFEWECTTVE